jgi:nucleotide-binding universal stress UspA family protein
MALALPIDEVAKAADVMFLFMFAQVNITVMTLRRRRPDLKRGFHVPFLPWPAVIGIVTNVALAGFLALETGRVGLVTAAWLVFGILLYLGYFQNREEMERPKEVLHQEALVSVDYSVLVPVATEEQAQGLGYLGGLLALNVIKVPQQLQLSDGRLFLKERRPLLEAVIAEAKQLGVPVHTMLRLGRSIPEAILKTSVENASDLILFGWPGKSGASDQWFGSVIDRIVANPPADTVIVRDRPYKELRRLLVPVSDGPNSRLAVKVAVDLASSTDEGGEVVLLNVRPPGVERARVRARAQNLFRRLSEGIDYPLETQMVVADNPPAGILEVAADFDMIILGATREPLFRNLLMGNVSEQVADEATCPVLLVKRRSSILTSMLRETVLHPAKNSR